ncbi:hypothetical protein KM427_01480 [Nocardioides sp. LMS-CY]|uniref:TOPRIM nucleotidyl transferase/hydrolase domain-containing protein n=1 Tax=Nocardioides sp. (strain LMS-CY) TaxID=2840457 RepID=UPI001C003B35|nr:TOPRIM nucleotidyl transferase/hydrolase domain-containing protein [Nocardioides sp. LMS-CY]QWF22449.1 hypothetical protein KM427_01480 [Nocardioides sp. LMS-CY]
MESPRVVVLVEGDSDRCAVHALARLLGHDLSAHGVAVVAMGGITNLRSSALRFGPRGLDLPLAGLYDAPEEHVVRRGLRAAGLTVTRDLGALSALGFFACTADLEDELIRALGVPAVERVIGDAGETRSLDLLAAMPAQRSWTRTEVLRRFLGSKAGRKARYAGSLTDALEPDRVPAPLAGVLMRAVDLAR